VSLELPFGPFFGAGAASCQQERAMRAQAKGDVRSE
jgi:hypothetical protein